MDTAATTSARGTDHIATKKSLTNGGGEAASLEKVGPQWTYDHNVRLEGGMCPTTQTTDRPTR